MLHIPSPEWSWPLRVVIWMLKPQSVHYFMQHDNRWYYWLTINKTKIKVVASKVFVEPYIASARIRLWSISGSINIRKPLLLFISNSIESNVNCSNSIPVYDFYEFDIDVRAD